MLQFWFLLSLFLICLIFLRIPKENSGLTTSITPTEFLGSPRQIEKKLNLLTAIGILLYLIIAFKLNTNV